VTNISASPRWISCTALWAIAVLCIFSPTASAHEHSARVVVMEDAGAGNGPERALQALGGRVDRELPIIDGFSAHVPRSALGALRGTPGVRSVNRDRRFKLRSTTNASLSPSTTLDTLRGIVGAAGVDGGARLSKACSSTSSLGRDRLGVVASARRVAEQDLQRSTAPLQQHLGASSWGPSS
jgi:hypothetical protein